MINDVITNGLENKTKGDEWKSTVEDFLAIISEKYKSDLTDNVFNFIQAILKDKRITYYKVNLIKLLSKYLTESYTDNIDVQALVDTFILNNSKEYCVADQNSVEDIIKKFMEIENNPITIIQVFYSLMSEDQTFNYEEWDVFLNHYQNYKNMPVSWSLNLIKENANNG